MGTVNADQFGPRKLTVEDLPEGHDAMLVTFVKQETVTMKLPDAEHETDNMVVTFKEYPDRRYWINPTGIKNAIAMFGNNDDNWSKKKWCLIRTEAMHPGQKKKVPVLHVASPVIWKQALADAGKKK